MKKKSPTPLKIAAIVFTITAFIYLWDWIKVYKLWILIGSGVVLLIYAMNGDFKLKKFTKGFKRRLK